MKRTGKKDELLSIEEIESLFSHKLIPDELCILLNIKYKGRKINSADPDLQCRKEPDFAEDLKRTKRITGKGKRGS